MAGLRTLVVGVAPLLADLVTRVLQPLLMLEMVGVVPAGDAHLPTLRAMAPDLVLLGLTGSDSDLCARPLLAALPTAKILVLAPNAEHAWLYESGRDRITLTDLSVPALIDTLTGRPGAANSRPR